MPRLLDIFRRTKAPKAAQELVITGRGSAFTTTSATDPYANDTFRAGVDAIAKIAAKFVLQPVSTFSDGTVSRCDDELAYVLQVRPNRFMTAYDLLYVMYTHLYVKSNAYAYLERDGRGNVVAIYPLHVTQCRFIEDQGGRIFAAFMLANGRPFVADYGDVVHLRRFYNTHDVNGDSNDAIAAGVALADAQNKGIQDAIRMAGTLKGIVRVKGSVGVTGLKEFKKEFEDAFLDPSRGGGIIASDATYEYQPFEFRDPAVITSEDQETVRRKVYDYLGLSESIVNGTFDDSTFGAFEEVTIEALALQTSLEFTCKIFGDDRSRRIECQTSRIRYMGSDSKNELLKNVLPMGTLTINEARDLMGLAPIDGGDYRIQSLNYANTDVVDRYQIARSGSNGVKTLEVGEHVE